MLIIINPNFKKILYWLGTVAATCFLSEVFFQPFILSAVSKVESTSNAIVIYLLNLLCKQIPNYNSISPQMLTSVMLVSFFVVDFFEHAITTLPEEKGIFSTDNAKINSFISQLKNNLKKSTHILVFLLAIGIINIYCVSHMVFNLANTTLNKIEIVAPHVEEIEYRHFKSDFYQIDCLSDYKELNNNLDNIINAINNV